MSNFLKNDKQLCLTLNLMTFSPECSSSETKLPVLFRKFTAIFLQFARTFTPPSPSPSGGFSSERKTKFAPSLPYASCRAPDHPFSSSLFLSSRAERSALPFPFVFIFLWIFVESLRRTRGTHRSLSFHQKCFNFLLVFEY